MRSCSYSCVLQYRRTSRSKEFQRADRERVSTGSPNLQLEFELGVGAGLRYWESTTRSFHVQGADASQTSAECIRRPMLRFELNVDPLSFKHCFGGRSSVEHVGSSPDIGGSRQQHTL